MTWTLPVVWSVSLPTRRGSGPRFAFCASASRRRLEATPRSPGAFDRQTGLLEQCDGGTLILDDVDRIPRDQQERLADVLDSGIVRPTGATHGFKIDLRVFATSDLDLEQEVVTGGFARALFDQLAVTRIRMPALRERLGDIPALTRYFLAKIGEQPGLKHQSIADSGLSLIEGYDWPGNVRQLQAALFRACVFEQREALTAHSFPQLAELLGDQADRGDAGEQGADDDHVHWLGRWQRLSLANGVGLRRSRIRLRHLSAVLGCSQGSGSLTVLRTARFLLTLVLVCRKK